MLGWQSGQGPGHCCWEISFAGSRVFPTAPLLQGEAQPSPGSLCSWHYLKTRVRDPACWKWWLPCRPSSLDAAVPVRSVCSLPASPLASRCTRSFCGPTWNPALSIHLENLPLFSLWNECLTTRSAEFLKDFKGPLSSFVGKHHLKCSHVFGTWNMLTSC